MDAQKNYSTALLNTLSSKDLTSPRAHMLLKAIIHTCGDREVEYGPPIVNMLNTARLIEAYLNGKYNLQLILQAEDAAWILTLVKIARTFPGDVKADTYEDAAAYSAIAGEIAWEEKTYND